MADWIFDGTNKIIKEPVGLGDTTFDVEQDIYSAWKRWVQSGNAQYDAAFTTEGGTPIGATGLFTGTTFILTNGWKLMAADHDHQVIVNGNLYSDDGIVSTSNPIGNSTLFVSATVGAQGISTSGEGGGLTPTESNQLATIFGRLPSDGEEMAGENDTAGGTWTQQEKEQVLLHLLELYRLQGLELGTPMTVTPNSRTAGSINLEITGDGETLTTVERQ